MKEKKEQYPILKKYPGIEDDYPLLPLGNYPTPVQRMTRLGRHINHSDLWIKRDDYTSEIYSGNKVRKFEFILGYAKKLGREKLISWGSIGSNQILASVIHSRGMHFKVDAVMFKQPVTECVLRNLFVDFNSGANLFYAGGYIRFAVKLLAVYIKNVLKKTKPFLVPYLFASIPSVLAYVNAMFELKIQIENGECPEPDFIFVPLGTGGTFCGIELGARIAGLKSKIIGTRITERIVCNEYIMAFIINRTLRYMRKKFNDINIKSYKADKIYIDHNQAGNGYGESTDKCIAAINQMRETEGLELDQTYTGKAIASVIEFAEKTENKNASILYWHTFNSVDLKEKAGPIENYKKLPKEFHKFFDELM